MPVDPLGWLDAWVADIRANPSASHASGPAPYDPLARAHVKAIAKLAADPDVRQRLHTLCRSVSDLKKQQDVKDAVKKFLTLSATLLRPKQAATTTQKRSQVIADMRSAADSIDALNRNLKMMSKPLGRALSTGYLEDRLNSGNLMGFSQNRRGWNLAIKGTQGSSIVDLLACLSADLREDACIRATQIAGRRQTGGKLKALHNQIDSIGGFASVLSSALGQPAGRASPALVASVVNCLLEPIEPLEADAVRKRLREAQHRKTRG